MAKFILFEIENTSFALNLEGISSIRDGEMMGLPVESILGFKEIEKKVRCYFEMVHGLVISVPAPINSENIDSVPIPLQKAIFLKEPPYRGIFKIGGRVIVIIDPDLLLKRAEATLSPG